MLALSPESERAFFFGEGAELFGVLYLPPGASSGQSGWVLCDAFGVERNNSHRLMVEWARELCARGRPVLRFDYRGTGDSAGNFDQFTVHDHAKDVLAAMGELERLTGRPPAGLLGLRLGAALAALAAARAGGVRQLVMWEPVVDGAAYREQLLRVDLANELVSSGPRHHSRQELRRELSQGGAVFVDGFPLTGSMYDSLAAIAPEALGRGAAGRALVVQIDARPGRPIRSELEALCGNIAATGLANLEALVAPLAWLRTKHFLWRPPELFSGTARWVETTAVAAAEAGEEEPGGADLPGAASPSPPAETAVRLVARNRIVERPVSFAVGDLPVSGVLHVPEKPVRGRPPVVMLAAGETCRSAVFYPWLARRLAAAGWPVLRFDPRGLGDSRGEIAAQSVIDVFVQIEGGLFVPDAAAAVGFMLGETGEPACILTGLCGGAITAVYAAAGDERVAAVMPLELRLLWDRSGEPAESRAGMRQLPWWERLSARRGGLPLLAVRRLLHRLRSTLGRFRLAAARLRRPGPAERPGGDGWFLEQLGESANLRVIGALRRVLDRGIPTLWVFEIGRASCRERV